MKIKTLFVVAGMIAGCNAASISLTNFDGSTSAFSGILNAEGSLLTSGVVALGTFTSIPTTTADLASFVQAGNSLSIANGFISGSINTPTLVAGDAFVGNSVWVVLGNGATLNESTQLAFYQSQSNPSGNVFTADNPLGGPDTVILNTEFGQTPVGSEVTFDFGGPNGVEGGFRLAPVPEPSVALLGLLGVAGFLRRRR